MIIPKLRNDSAQSRPYYIFVNFCIQFKSNPYNFYFLNHIKKIATIIISNVFTIFTNIIVTGHCNMIASYN